jgi:hypothetical protein
MDFSPKNDILGKVKLTIFFQKKTTVTTHFLREDQLFAAKIRSKIIPKSGEKIQSNCSIIDHSHIDPIGRHQIPFGSNYSARAAEHTTILLLFTFLNFSIFPFRA